MEKRVVIDFLRSNWWQVGLMVTGGALMCVGIFLAQRQTVGNELKIISDQPEVVVEVKNIQILVDIAGSIENPGLVRLSQGSRIGDVIVAAGGLSASADRSWVARFLNQAEVARDGMKIYVPAVGEKTEEIPHTGKTVSVNSASESDLDGLWGVGEARAKAIVANRPYASLSELVSKAQIPQDVLDNNEGKIGL